MQGVRTDKGVHMQNEFGDRYKLRFVRVLAGLEKTRPFGKFFSTVGITVEVAYIIIIYNGHHDSTRGCQT